MNEWVWASGLGGRKVEGGFLSEDEDEDEDGDEGWMDVR